MKSKEALEVLKGTHLAKAILEPIEKDLERLEQIDNANPSEALEKIVLLASELGTSKDTKFAETRFPKMLLTIRQALLKAHEQDKILKSLNEYKETIKKRIESLEEYKKYTFIVRNETEYFQTIGRLEAYSKILDVLNEVLDNDK